MKKINNKIILIVGLISIIGIFKGCSKMEIKIHEEYTSPNGIYTAYAYSFQGGATVSFNQAVSIIETDNKKAKEMLVEERPNIYFNTNTADENIKVEWKDDNELRVISNENLEDIYYIKLKVDIFNGIKINYKES